MEDGHKHKVLSYLNKTAIQSAYGVFGVCEYTLVPSWRLYVWEPDKLQHPAYHMGSNSKRSLGAWVILTRVYCSVVQAHTAE
jgi:hypothetical protein